jgi:lysophospholipase L1-like esterase
MQATHGFAVSFRKRGRLIGCCMALVLALSAVVLTPAANAVAPPVTTYLALGDSLAFGYSQEKFENNYPNDAPAYFEEGYANFYAKKVKANKEIANKGLVLVNNGCPGETTDSLIGNGPLGSVVDPEGESPCAYQKKGLPLHNPYPVSQLEDALSILNSGKPAHPITAISLNIGANDELKAVHLCEKEISEELKGEKPPHWPGETPQEKLSACVGTGAPVTFHHILHNIGTIIVVLDHYGGYSGPIILNGYYNPDAFLLGPSTSILQRELNTAVTEKLLPALASGCYGAAEKECEEAAKGEKEFSEVKFEPPITNVKFANPFKKFNPEPFATTKQPGGTKAAKNALEKYTEMFNPQDIERNEAGTCITCEGKPTPGGDIHPTKAGYEVIAKVMYEVAKL